jgi:prepilin-type N-terminal cleavage/methylation domain-containing protein
MSMREESGFTLTELLVAITLTLVVLSATLTTLEVFATSNQRNLTLNDMRETARRGIDNLAQELRNAAARSVTGTPVERAEAFDLVFADVDPSGGGTGATSSRRVRYCLEQTTAETGKLWRQEQAWAATLPAATACPHADFGSTRLVADGVVNHAVDQGGAAPPVFRYDSTELAQITTLASQLFVDTDVDRDPATTELRTSVEIRNRNRPPTAEFTATPQGNRHVLLNAGGSTDPEGQQLEYDWYCNGSPCPSWVEGPVVDYQTATTGSHTFGLKVIDPGGLTSPLSQRTVTVP